MAFTVPDKAEGDSNIQSILFQEYLDVLVAGINGIDCVLSGLAVTGGADMTPAVAKGAVLSNGALFAVAAADVTVTAADGTNPRIDLIVVTNAGALAVRAGTAAAAPKPPARSANDVVIAAVYIPATDTSIGSSQVTDLRVIRTQGPIVLKKTTSPVTFNTNATIQTYFTITLPSGLMATGKVLRVRCGGSYLANNSTPTFILTIAYGGTTMFADVSIAGTADADRGGWYLNFDLIQQGASDEALVGIVTFTNTVTAAHIPPTSGIAGDLLGSVAVAARPVTSPIVGSAAVDSDAADRTLTVQWTMSVSNVANEVTMEFGIAELL